MPDISMCRGILCPSKDFCYRHTAKPSEYQLWMNFEADLKPGDTHCEAFWPAETPK